jgi:hypothetical protein
VLPLAIARQSFKTVAWRRPQVAEIARGVAQFPARHLDQIGRKALRTFAVEDGFGGLVPDLITGSVYHLMIQLSKSGYQSMILPSLLHLIDFARDALRAWDSWWFAS